MPIVADIGQRIINVRKKLGLNQGQAGIKAGLSQTVMSSIERGEGGATLENLLALITAFNINPVWLLLGQGPMFLHEAIQPYVLHSLQKTAELIAGDAPALQDLIQDEELSAVGEITYEELQFLGNFLRDNRALNNYIRKDGLIAVLEAHRARRLDTIQKMYDLLRSRANRSAKGE